MSDLVAPAVSRHNTNHIDDERFHPYQNKHGEVARLLLNTTGVHADATQNDGFSPLHYAASVGLPEVADLLLARHDVDVNRSVFGGSKNLHAV